MLTRYTMRIALKVFALSETCMHGYCVALRVFAHPQILCQRSKSEPLGARASTCMHMEHVLGCIPCVRKHAPALARARTLTRGIGQKVLNFVQKNP